jgi:hypothetical protein
VRTPTSRIDDIATTVADQQGHSTALIDTTCVQLRQLEADHQGLRWTCPYQTLQMTPPPLESPALTDDGTRKLQTPIPAEAYSKSKIRLQEQLPPKYTATIQRLIALAAEVAQHAVAQQPTNPNTPPVDCTSPQQQ